MRNNSWRRRLSRGKSGLAKLLGFGLSVIVLGVAGLLVIPAMVSASGAEAWGAIAVGQIMGTVGSFVVSYGWKISGPTKVARVDATERRREFFDSIRVRLTLLLPVGAVTVAVTSLVAHTHHGLAGAGAVSALVLGLTNQWYFAGVAKPYAMLLLETVPRVIGSFVGIALMYMGETAMTGLICITLGMAVGFVSGCVWVWLSTGRAGAVHAPRRPIATILRDQAKSTVPSLVSAVYLAVPVTMVSLVAPSAVPTYALADKINRQSSQGLAPIITVLQGWVPRGKDGMLTRRAHAAFVAVLVIAVVLVAGFIVVGPLLFRWLGDGQIIAPTPIVVLTALLIGTYLLDQILGRVVLVAFDKIGVIARANVASAIVGLPLALLGALVFGAQGALFGVLAGVVVRVAIELWGYLAERRSV
jgi:O-antigen/teichoic acid export membrane protein